MWKKAALVVALTLPTLAQASPYLVAGGAFGTADMEDVEATYGTGASLNTDDEVTRGIVGIGADINTHVGLEALYLSKAETTVRDSFGQQTAVTHSGLQVSLIGKLPVTDQISLFGKVSGNFFKVRAEFTSPVLPATNFGVGDDVADFGFGLGAQFKVNDSVGVRLGLERIQIRDAFDGFASDSNVDQASLALTYAL